MKVIAWLIFMGLHEISNILQFYDLIHLIFSHKKLFEGLNRWHHKLSLTKTMLILFIQCMALSQNPDAAMRVVGHWLLPSDNERKNSISSIVFLT